MLVRTNMDINATKVDLADFREGIVKMVLSRRICGMNDKPTTGAEPSAGMLHLLYLDSSSAYWNIPLGDLLFTLVGPAMSKFLADESGALVKQSGSGPVDSGGLGASPPLWQATGDDAGE